MTILACATNLRAFEELTESGLLALRQGGASPEEGQARLARFAAITGVSADGDTLAHTVTGDLPAADVLGGNTAKLALHVQGENAARQITVSPDMALKAQAALAVAPTVQATNQTPTFTPPTLQA